MKRTLTIFYTSDIHGFLSPIDYSSGHTVGRGLAACAALFDKDDNTLIIDGGDTLQGSPLSCYLAQEEGDAVSIPAAVMDIAGYDFIVPGNHDFDYGKETLEQYIAAVRARCLCANIDGLAGAEKTALIQLPNGLRIGLVGVTTQHVTRWEQPDKLSGLQMGDAFEAAAAALEQLRRLKPDITICIYHGGFEKDPATGRLLSDTDENEGFRICRELDFDLLLTAHQHMPLAPVCVSGTYTCQPPDKATGFIRLELTKDLSDSTEKLQLTGSLCEPSAAPSAKVMEVLTPIEEKNARWLDTPVGFIDVPLPVSDPLSMASHGSLIANFFNQVQLEVSGADISATSLSNNPSGFSQSITIRDIVSGYVFPNTLITVEITGEKIKKALEQSASYFDYTADGALCISNKFLIPVEQHYNYDYFSGLSVTIDPHRPVGSRVTSLCYRGEPLADDAKLSLCLNNYRASGAGGYEVYRSCPVLREYPTEIAQLIIDYVLRHKSVRADKTKWLTLTEYPDQK